jgi:hypothetical protein
LCALWGGCARGSRSAGGVGVSKVLVPMAAEDVELLLCRFDDFAVLSLGGGGAVVVPSRERPMAVGAPCLFGVVGTGRSNMLVYTGATDATVSESSTLREVTETLTSRVIASDCRFLVD